MHVCCMQINLVVLTRAGKRSKILCTWVQIQYRNNGDFLKFAEFSATQSFSPETGLSQIFKLALTHV